MNAEQPNIPPQHQRWLKYGLNAAVLVVGMLLILFVINYVAFHHTAGGRRMDFTHNRRYTLSPQTLRLLEKLDRPVTITTLYKEGSTHREQLAEVDNLLAGYQNRGKKITVRHIDPVTDVAGYEKLTQDLVDRFKDEVSKRKPVIDAARESVAQLKELFDKQAAALDALANAVKPTPEAAKFVEEIRQSSNSLKTQLPKIEKALNESTTVEMPDFETIRGLIASSSPGAISLQLFSTGLLEPVITEFTVYLSRKTGGDAAEEPLRALRDLYRKVNQQITKVVEMSREIQFGGYEEVQSQLKSQDCVVITAEQTKPPEPPARDRKEAARPTDRGVSVLTIDQLFPQYVSQKEGNARQRAEQAYKGEEAITSALFKLTLNHKTRVVFVNASQQPMLMRPNMGDPGGSYAMVAQRLRAMNFDVEEWQPGGGMQFGRPMPPQPKPVAKEGETLILIALPGPMPDPRMPFNPAEGPALDAVKEHIDAGRPALVMSNPVGSLEAAAQPWALADPLGKLGITVERGKLILRPLPGHEKGGVNQLEMTPAGDHPVANAIRGLPGVLLAVQPVMLKPTEGVEQWPLLTTAKDTWASGSAWPLSRDKIPQLQQAAGEPNGPFTAAAAAKKGQQRIVVVADPVWASDALAAYSQGAISADLELSAISVYPANAELFVNSVYWLAGLDDVIAPGAKTQETRRVAEISDSKLNAIRWLLLAGLPAACLAAGIAVWFVRRK